MVQAPALSGHDGLQPICALSVARTALLLVLTLAAGAPAAVALAPESAPRTAPLRPRSSGVRSGLLSAGTFTLLAG